jgi:hypothetical protein
MVVLILVAGSFCAGPAADYPPATAGPAVADEPYLAQHAALVAELHAWKFTDPQRVHGDSRWGLFCDAAPRGLLPRSHKPWSHTGTVTFATWWEVLQFDGLVYMMRGLINPRTLLVLRNLCAAIRLSVRGASTLGQPASAPADIVDRTARALAAFEDITPVVMHRHNLHLIIHLVRTSRWHSCASSQLGQVATLIPI